VVAGDGPHDGQAQPGTAGLRLVPAAGVVEPDEAVESPLAVGRRDARAVI
jgi:hypothetical protein